MMLAVVTSRLKQGRERGFTLIEVMVATAIFTLSVSVIWNLQVQAVKTSVGAARQSQAMALMLDLQEMFFLLPPDRLQAFVEGDSGKVFDRNGNLVPDGSDQAFYRVTTSAIQSSASYKTIQTNIQWSNAGDDVPHVMSNQLQAVY